MPTGQIRPQDIAKLLPDWIIAGIPRDILELIHNAISGFITSANLEKASVGGQMRIMKGKQVLSEENIVKHNIRGGMKAHHIHFGDEIYLLSEQQWKEFSTHIVQGIQTKLKGAGTVRASS